MPSSANDNISKFILFFYTYKHIPHRRLLDKVVRVSQLEHSTKRVIHIPFLVITQLSHSLLHASYTR